MEIITYVKQDHYLISLSGNVDTEKVGVLNQNLEKCLNTAIPAILVDCDKLTNVCIAGLRSLLRYQKLYHNKNKSIIVFGLQPHLKSVFFDTGLDRFISVAGSYNQALEIVRQ